MNIKKQLPIVLIATLLAFALSNCGAPAAAPAPAAGGESASAPAAAGESASAQEYVETDEDLQAQLTLLKEHLPQESQPDGTDCIISPDGHPFGMGGTQVYASRGAAGLHLESVNVPHGELVHRKFLSLLGSIPVGARGLDKLDNGYGDVAILELDDFQFEDEELALHGGIEVGSVDTNSAMEIRIDGEDYDHKVILVKVDTLGFDAATAKDQIVAAINGVQSQSDQLDHQGRPIDRFVLNMSFAVIPCEGLHITNFQEYEDLLVNDNELQELRNELERYMSDKNVPAEQHNAIRAKFKIQIILRSRLPDYYRGGDYADEILSQYANDPLSNLLNEYAQKGDMQVISVAAAGNHGYPFPFVPGLWERVVSVTSSSVQGYWPNDGEVAMNDGVTYDGKFIPGTSFAAPELSYHAAFYLLYGGKIDNCSGKTASISPISPPLAYEYHVDGAPRWDNLSLPNAAEQFCSVFPTFR